MMFKSLIVHSLPTKVHIYAIYAPISGMETPHLPEISIEGDNRNTFAQLFGNSAANVPATIALSQMWSYKLDTQFTNKL